MSETKANEIAAATTSENENSTKTASTPAASSSNATTPASSVTGIPSSKLKAPTNFSGSTGTISKIGRLCSHATPKPGPPPRDTNSMSRESDDNLSSINSTYTDMYQETVKRFTRSSLSPEMDRYSPSRISMKSTSPSQKSDGDRHASYHGAVLTADTEQFIIGQKVWVGGIRSGQIAYIGETHFAPGDWAGVVLDDPNGKNDGCVAGKRYFQCEPKRGIFSRLTRLTLMPLPGAYTPTSPLSKNSPERSRTVSPTASIRSSFLRSPGKNGLTVGDRIIVSSGFGSRPGILRYLGETQFASGNWCGVELDEGTGKNDGAVDGIRYFECKPKYGVFVPIAKVSLSPSSKKSRLSRTGSRESLNSIGTMNSIATTNTSRMRMNAQRKSSLIKPVTSPKNQFSMQDLLREKQNHIEQLMIERDLDREDAQNQALQFQKNISELQARVAKLERELQNERKKSEDLQLSMDEATFCGDELNAQTQVYQEKIHDLERKITGLVSGASSLQTSAVHDILSSNAAATEAANAQISELRSKLQEQSKQFEARQSAVRDEETRLQENIKYLQTENESLQKELLEKDESLEKFSLSESGLENLRRELALLKQENESERQKTQADFAQQLAAKNVETQRLTEELTTLQNTLWSIEGERTNTEEECDILRAECRSRDEQLQDVKQKLAKLTAELSMQRAESATLEELLKAQQLGSAEGQTALEQKTAEATKLQQQIAELQSAKTNLELKLKGAGEELQQLVKVQQTFEQKLKDVSSADEEKLEAMQQLQKLMEELKQQVNETNLKNGLLTEQLKLSEEANANAGTKEQSMQKQLAEKEKTHMAIVAELQATKEIVVQLQTELANLVRQSEEKLGGKSKELEQLHAEMVKWQEKTRALEGESSTNVQQMSAKIDELEAQLKRLQEQLKLSEAALAKQRQEQLQQEALLAEKRTQLKTSASALETTNSLLEKLKQEQELALANCKQLEQQLKQSEEREAQQQLGLGDFTRKCEALSTKSADLAAQNETLQQDILTARTSGSNLQSELRKLNEEAAAKQRELSELQANSNAERIKLESQLEQLNQRLSNADKDYAELKDTLQEAKAELAKKSEQTVALEERTVKQELALSDAQRQQENLQTKHDALIAQNATLQESINALRTTSTDSNVELLKLTQDVATRQKAYEELLDKASVERAALESQLQAGQQRVDALCNQVETLTQELKSATELSFKRFEQLKQEQDRSSQQALELGDLARKLETVTVKSANLETQNEALQSDLHALRTASTDSNAELLKLTEQATNKQKALQEYTDKASAERLQLESQLQELTQRMQTSQAEAESLRNELTAAAAAQSTQAAEFERLKAELQANTLQLLQDEKAAQAAERRKLLENFEAQLKMAEQTKISLDEAISSLQNQIRLLQDELLKSQLAFKAREAELSQQLAAFVSEKELLHSTLQQVQTERSSTLSSVQQERTQLQQSFEQLSAELQEKERQLQAANGEAAQLKLAQTNVNSDLTKLQAELNSLKSALELSQTEVEHKEKLAEQDKSKIDELKRLLEAVQASNANISATNAELSAALELLEQDKYETSHIFELFEMETDQTAAQLIEKLSSMKQQLADAQAQLHSKDTALTEAQKLVQSTSADLQTAHSTLQSTQSSLLDHTTKLAEMSQANDELTKALTASDAQKEQRNELELQLAEYKNIVDEMDDASTEKTSELSALQERIQTLERENHAAAQSQKALKLETASLERKLEIMDLEKTREIVALQARLNDLQTSSKLPKQNGGGDESEDIEVSTAQINFLNSIIADMQKKNETLKAKIEALEALPMDFTKPHAFDIFTKRKPAPRMFCDICDVFDKHETEDCPVQASSDREYSPPPSAEANNNDPANKKERKLPAPRKYCVTCEVFGHETGECDDECF